MAARQFHWRTTTTAGTTASAEHLRGAGHRDNNTVARPLRPGQWVLPPCRLSLVTKSVGVHEAKTHLSRLLLDVQRGEEVVITRRGEEVARLVPPAVKQCRRFGIDEGVFQVPDDFDEALDEQTLASFER